MKTNKNLHIMYLAQTNLEVDTTKQFVYTNPNGTKVLVFKTKPGVFNPEIHVRKPPLQMIPVIMFVEHGRDSEIYEITPRVKLALTEI